MTCIRAVLNRNQFKCRLSFNFEGTLEKDLVAVDAILDTGCNYSHISANLIYAFFSDKERMDTKAKFMKSRVVTIGKGIESNDKIYNTDITDVNNPSIIIRQRCYNVCINGINIGNRYLSVSYDTSCIALIGMSIMKDWDIHTGKSKDGNIVFLGCPYDQLNQDYYVALENEFGISEKLNSSIVNNKLKK